MHSPGCRTLVTVIRWLRKYVGVLAVCALVAACGDGDSAGPGSAPTGSGKAASSGQATASTSPSPTTTEPVTIAFGGDVHFEDEVAERLDDDPQSTLGPVSALLSAADVAMVNLESAVTTGGSAVPKTYTFRAPPAAFRALSAAGVDVATMANNHGMDYGLEGLRDSLAAANEHNFPVVGIGRDAAQAYAPHIVTVHGQRVAFIGATQVIDSVLVDDWTAQANKPGLASAKEVDRLVAAVRKTRPKVDTLAVYLHWGRSLEPCPLDRQQRLARKLSEAGADIIVGTHAHRLLAGGSLQGSYVHYGLGNFVWYNSDPPGGLTGVLTLTVRGSDVVKAEWAPAVISGGIPQVLTGAEAQQERADWKDLRECTDLSPVPQSRKSPATTG